jgi:hypothetical protein
MAKNDEITFDDLEPTAEVANALAAHEKESNLARERAAAALAEVNAEIDAETQSPRMSKAEKQARRDAAEADLKP